MAAQNCRRRKLDLIGNLSEEIIRAREYKQQLLAEREQLYRMRNEWSNKLLQLEEQVLRGLDKSSDDYALELMPHSQQIRVAPRGGGGAAGAAAGTTVGASAAASAAASSRSSLRRRAVDPSATTTRLAKPARA